LRDAGCTFYEQPTQDLNLIANRFMQKRVDTAANPNDVETRLQACVVMKRVRIEEFFLDFDKLRKGKVTNHQFYSILSMMNFHLTKEELDSLAARYNCDGMFNYKDFCANINGAFTTYGIQKNPMAQVNKVTVDNTVQARKRYLDMTAEDQDMVRNILVEYAQAIQIRRIHMKQMF